MDSCELNDTKILFWRLHFKMVKCSMEATSYKAEGYNYSAHS